jgi:hypothetical protein
MGTLLLEKGWRNATANIAGVNAFPSTWMGVFNLLEKMSPATKPQFAIKDKVNL